MTILGTSGDDNLLGTAGTDTFDLTQGGTDIVSGLGGNDHFKFGATLTAADQVNGGAGNDVLYLNGDYSALHIFAPATINSIETIKLSGGHSYYLQTQNGNVATGETLTIDATALGAGDTAQIFFSDEIDGNVKALGGAGNDTLYGGGANETFNGGAGNDQIYANSTVHDTVNGGDGNDHVSVQRDAALNISGGAGNDSVNMQGFLSATDKFDGGDGSDEMDLSGDYSAGLSFKAMTMVNTEVMFFGGGFSYKIKMNDGNVAAGQSVFATAGLLAAGNTLYFDAAKETNGTYQIFGGGGDDTIFGGQAGNIFHGANGLDKITAGLGTDVFKYDQVIESTGVGRDVITGFDTHHDSFDFIGAVSGIDAARMTGTLNKSHFDTDMTKAVDAGHLAAGHAMLFTPSAGNYAGHTFLVVDTNGTAGYQAGQDFVIQLETASHLIDLAMGNFT